jgi:hypothetical protein
MPFALQYQSVSSKYLRVRRYRETPEPIPKRGISHLFILSLSGYFPSHKWGVRRQNPQKTARQITVNPSINLEKGAIKNRPEGRQTYMDRQASAHFLHSAAHFWQWSSLNFAQLVEHSSQIVAHSWQNSLACLESDDIRQAASLQTPAHSII